VYTIHNANLTVTLLDPATDRERFGTRYCTGGYIFQVADAQIGPLLSGPTYPDDFNVFDGQGIPDAFSRNPLRDKPTDSEGQIIGIGRCDLQANTVLEFCPWEVEQSDAAITMTTEQSLGGIALRLVRHVSVAGRTLRSHIELANTGQHPIPLSWYPHPFFPQLEGTDELCRFNIPIGFPDNDGFKIADSGYIARKNWPWDQAGKFQALDHEAPGNLVVFQKHPALGLIAATLSYVPAFFPIWGNKNTFSWEPFLERTVFRGQTLRWSIEYEF
jgi:hypothetical protein|tara:strand:- start:1759 stop:2577 length:819 start_codon:yes stop_codon:yes gene_type:complete